VLQLLRERLPDLQLRLRRAWVSGKALDEGTQETAGLLAHAACQPVLRFFPKGFLVLGHGGSHPLDDLLLFLRRLLLGLF
jgi:hypothetical protein